MIRQMRGVDNRSKGNEELGTLSIIHTRTINLAVEIVISLRSSKIKRKISWESHPSIHQFIVNSAETQLPHSPQTK